MSGAQVNENASSGSASLMIQTKEPATEDLSCDVEQASFSVTDADRPRWEAEREPSKMQRPEVASLARVIETKVIPRMLLARRQNGFKAPLDDAETGAKLHDMIGEFADLVIDPDGTRARSYFQDLITKGSSVETLFQDLIGPTALRLGELWDEDINSMLDVTQGLGHLQRLVRTFAPDLRQKSTELPSSHRALLIALPGETHTLGISLVEEYFRREGWSVWGGPLPSMEELVALISTMWFDMIGLSAARLQDPEKLAFDIRILRGASRNRNVAIMVGGWPFLQHPELAFQVGADATGADGPQAVAQIRTLLGGAKKRIL
jgi:MerR family transcriptional regulator, light-induced transcriptional regulator